MTGSQPRDRAAAMASTLVRLEGGRPLLLCLHTADAPSDEEWDTFLGHAKRWLDDNPTVRDVPGFVVTDGGGPSALQRQRMRDLIADDASPPGAIISNSRLVRGMVTALRWFVPMMRSFKPADSTAALAHLRLKSDDVIAVQRALSRLQLQLPAVASLQQIDFESSSPTSPSTED